MNYFAEANILTSKLLGQVRPEDEHGLRIILPVSRPATEVMSGLRTIPLADLFRQARLTALNRGWSGKIDLVFLDKLQPEKALLRLVATADPDVRHLAIWLTYPEGQALQKFWLQISAGGVVKIVRDVRLHRFPPLHQMNRFYLKGILGGHIEAFLNLINELEAHVLEPTSSS